VGCSRRATRRGRTPGLHFGQFGERLRRGGLAQSRARIVTGRRDCRIRARAGRRRSRPLCSGQKKTTPIQVGKNRRPSRKRPKVRFLSCDGRFRRRRPPGSLGASGGVERRQQHVASLPAPSRPGLSNHGIPSSVSGRAAVRQQLTSPGVEAEKISGRIRQKQKKIAFARGPGPRSKGAVFFSFFGFSWPRPDANRQGLGNRRVAPNFGRGVPPLLLAPPEQGEGHSGRARQIVTAPRYRQGSTFRDFLFVPRG